MRSFGPCRSAISASGRPSSSCTVADDAGARRVVLLRAVREVEPGRVHAGLDERATISCDDDAGPIVATIFVAAPLHSLT